MQSDFVELVLANLEYRYGSDLHTELAHRNNTELFVAVLLSPQCNDKQVNKATERLFGEFKSFQDYAYADAGTLKRYLSGLNYYKTKARNLKEASRIIVEKFGGTVPSNMNDLLKLPGVGRKVANVILNEGFGIDDGIAVDTHCAVVARRLRLSRHRNPEKIEQDLMRKIPQRYWSRVSNLFIALGRDTCRARQKECARCVLKNICPSSNAKDVK